MSKNNDTIKNEKKQYRHLTKKDRQTIETLASQVDENGKRIFSNTYIANYVGVHKSTISRELRNRRKTKINVITGKCKLLPYSAINAQEDADLKRGLSKCNYKLEKNKKMKKFIEDKIKNDKWAPDAIVGYMKKHNYFERDGFESITTPTVYYAIRNNIIDVKIEDTRRMKYKREYNYHKKDVPASKQEYSINNRPEEVDKRLIFGHFELDTVIGTRNGQHECLMTLTERKTRFEIAFKLNCKSSEEVVKKFNQIKEFMKTKYDKIFKSLTTDNGPEFSDFLNIIKDTKTQIYFCHPYCSGEKGTNEKHNGMIRYFIPKGELIENYSYDEINKIVDWMNNYPRKILDYKTPLEAVQEEFNDKSTLNKLYKLQEKINCI